MSHPLRFSCLFFFFNDTATTEIYTLSLHDALPISIRNRVVAEPGDRSGWRWQPGPSPGGHRQPGEGPGCQDRKSTRLNSSHSQISYAVFCLKKKNIMHFCPLPRLTELFLIHSSLDA